MFCKCGLDDHVYSVYEEEIRKLKEENTELLLKLCRNEGPIK